MLLAPVDGGIAVKAHNQLPIAELCKRRIPIVVGAIVERLRRSPSVALIVAKCCNRFFRHWETPRSESRYANSPNRRPT